VSYPVSGNANVTPAPSIHTVPPVAKGANPGLALAKQLEAQAEFILEGFIGQVLIAFGGIVIGGVKPFAALAAIGQALIAQAQAAYTQSVTAQTTATDTQTALNSSVPASAITSTNPNLLTAGGFDDSISMIGAGLWTWDGTTGHTANGAASTIANGTMKALLSNSIPVTAGQSLTPSAWVKTSSYVGTGTPIRLSIRTYLAGVSVGTTVIQSIAGPGSTWTQLSGSYTVPAGVDSVRLRLVVDTTATGGTVWFDDANLDKPGNGPFDGILSMFGLGTFGDLFSLNPSTVWQSIISDIINPLGLLAQLTGGKVPNGQSPQIVQDLLDGVVNVFQTGTTGTSSNNDFTTWFNSMLGIHKTGAGAQAQNVVQDTQINKLLTSGSGIFDTFDGAQATALNSTNWEQTYSGAGSGTCGLSGTGTATWATSGASSRMSQNRYKTALTTDTQLVQVILTSNLGASTISNNPAIRIQGRENSTHDSYVEARVTYNSAEIGYVVSGTYTRFGSAVSISGNTSGTWQLKLGTVASSREFVLMLNNVTVVDVTDGSAASQLGSSYRYTGFTHVTGVQWLGGLLFFQLPAPDVDSFGCSDRLAAL
jgi:hypothetical protein